MNTSSLCCKKVESGELTEEDADQIQDWLDQAPEAVNQIGGPKAGMSGRGGERGMEGLRAYAELKDITIEEARDLVENSAQTAFELAESEGLFEALKQQMLNDMQAMLDKGIEEGRLNDENASEMLQNIETAFDAWTDASNPPEDMHKMGMMGPNSPRNMPNQPKQ